MAEAFVLDPGLQEQVKYSISSAITTGFILTKLGGKELQLV